MSKPVNGSTRSALLARAALEAGDEWAQALISELRGERRSACGGWPGTLSEAPIWWRRRLQRRDEPSVEPLSAHESDVLTRSTYAHARAAWRARAVPEPPPVP